MEIAKLGEEREEDPRKYENGSRENAWVDLIASGANATLKDSRKVPDEENATVLQMSA